MKETELPEGVELHSDLDESEERNNEKKSNGKIYQKSTKLIVEPFINSKESIENVDEGSSNDVEEVDEEEGKSSKCSERLDEFIELLESEVSESI